MLLMTLTFPSPSCCGLVSPDGTYESQRVTESVKELRPAVHVGDPMIKVGGAARGVERCRHPYEARKDTELAITIGSRLHETKKGPIVGVLL